MSKYVTEWWAVTKPEIILDVLKAIAEFGVVIAKIEFRSFRDKELCSIALIMPYSLKDMKKMHTHRSFIKMLWAFGDEHTYEYGLRTCTLPMSPYAPGIGPAMKLEDCLYVPENFSTIEISADEV